MWAVFSGWFVSSDFLDIYSCFTNHIIIFVITSSAVYWHSGSSILRMHFSHQIYQTCLDLNKTPQLPLSVIQYVWLKSRCKIELLDV